MDRAAAPLGLVAAKPEDRRPAPDGTKRQHGGEPRRARPIIGFRGEQLMHPPARQAAAKRRIERRMPGGDPLVRGQQPSPGNRGQIPPEHGKMINRLAHHLFLICSQVRFARRESSEWEISGNLTHNPAGREADCLHAGKMARRCCLRTAVW